MKFRDKMKDVELHPYMLAIYKDNEHHHLLRHAIKSWEIRKRGMQDPRSHPNYLFSHPITFSAYPPFELIEQHEITPHSIIGSKIIRCPRVLKWAVSMVLNEPDGDLVWPLTSSSFWNYLAPHVEWDDELIFKMIQADLYPFLVQYGIKLTDEQHATAIICA